MDILLSFAGDAQCKPLVCNVFGKQCQGVLVGEEITADNQLQCSVNNDTITQILSMVVFSPLQCHCDDERDCNYYTYNVEYKLCSLFATCEPNFDCPACVTGDEQCWQELEGGDCSLSPTTAATTTTTTESSNDLGM